MFFTAYFSIDQLLPNPLPNGLSCYGCYSVVRMCTDMHSGTDLLDYYAKEKNALLLYDMSL
ncbi:hypothetical protein OUZ56_031886 [Daphnia magna]|uniref:Uncharacterized protein n=1 Tax=Daphnia magna TaxID=35525 RepID=A0ABQ9ZVI5_9CRUS|nr:hypothetical protein OUZ56_031886 [Daphnia magna]